MRVFLTGASGFVGSAILTQLIRSHYEVTCLVRPGSAKKLPVYPTDRVRLLEGDLRTSNDVAKGLSDCDAIIHLVGIIREFPQKGITFHQTHVEATEKLVSAAEQAGVKRFIHMSALGAKIGSLSPYQHTKGLAELIVKQSSLAWTIFQPSVIFGSGDEFVNMLADLIRQTPLVPVPGNGKYELQPVGIQNVAEAFVLSLSDDQTSHQTYEVGGPRAYSYNRILDLIGEALHRKKIRKLHIPFWLLTPIVTSLQGIEKFPLTLPQLFMLKQGNACDERPFFRHFNIDPIPFAEGIKLYLD